MIEKDHDPFFDEGTGADPQRDQLMKMIDSHDKSVRTNFNVGSKISGKVTRIGSEYIFVDIGAKNEAMIKRNEIEDAQENDEITAFEVSESSGEIILSKSLGGHSAPIQNLYDAMNNGIPVQGKVTGINKGGLNVKILGHRAFCPTSQVDIKFVEDINGYLGKTLPFAITRITEGGRNVVVSRVPLMEKDLEVKIDSLEEMAKNQTSLKGTVTRITNFGLFVDLGDIEGLIHISEISWERAENLEASFVPGQEIEFAILKVEKRKPLRNSKISLSIKQLLGDPWAAQNFSIGQSVEGKVTRITNFGAFIELTPGIEGLVHLSEMSWVKRIHHPSEVVSEGDRVRVTIVGIDEVKKNVSLTLKDVASDPWNDVEEHFTAGSDVEGVVAKKSRYGYFVDLAEGITGLLVFSNISSDKKDTMKEGDRATVHIESIDKENRRIALSMGIKELRQNAQEVTSFLKGQEKKPSKSSTSTEFGAALLEALKNKK
jgi:small subunit ribosomal protein S1